MKIIFCGYRDWALNAHFELLTQQSSGAINNVSINAVFSPDQLKECLRENPDVDALFLAGWSWIIPKEICEQHLVVGMHPSDLPAYAGGSPLQHQILDGITKTKASLFRITPKLDNGPILLKEDLSLDGNMSTIFGELTRVTVQMFLKFVVQLETNSIVEVPQLETPKPGWGPTIPGAVQVGPGLYVEEKPRKRLKPENSALTKDLLSTMTARQLYDFIRCHEDPYPNAYVEDETGRLEFKLVGFKDDKAT